MRSSRQRRRTHRQKRRGGALTGAPLSYTMTPGSTVNVYGRFPTEIASDPQSIQDLDVYYRSALSHGCGTEDSSRQVPADMGSNRVQTGGASLFDLPRPFLAGTPPNMAQSLSSSWSGATEPVPIPSSPVYQNWGYQSSVLPSAIDPKTFISTLPGSTTYGTWRTGGRRKQTKRRRASSHKRRRTISRRR